MRKTDFFSLPLLLFSPPLIIVDIKKFLEPFLRKNNYKIINDTNPIGPFPSPISFKTWVEEWDDPPQIFEVQLEHVEISYVDPRISVKMMIIMISGAFNLFSHNLRQLREFIGGLSYGYRFAY